MKLLDRLAAAFRKTPVPQKRYVFAGAQQNRLTADWFASWMSARQERRYELRLLRMRSRELCRNNAYGRRFLNLLAQNVVGPDGIDCEPFNETAQGRPYDQLNEAIEEAWDAWGDARTCTMDGTLCWDEVCSLTLQTIARDGEAFIRIVPYAPNPFGFALQFLDADQFDESYERAPSPGQNGISMGIEFDQWGREVAGWMWTTHPADTLGARDRKRVRIPSSELLHLYVPRRPGELRGEPWLAPAMFALKLLDGYTEAEIVAARTAAAKMGWIQQTEGVAGPDPLDESQQNQTMDAAAGVIERLNPGETFQGWDPTHPSGNFGPFMDAVLHQIAMGFNVSHASLTGNLSQTSFSSMRTGALDERDGYRMHQAFLVNKLCNPVYAAWLPMASLTGAVRLPSEDVSKWGAVQWEPRGWDWVDPLSDTRADVMAIAAGLDTRTAVVAKRGKQWLEDVAQVLKQEKDAADALGLTFVADVPGAQPAPNDAGGADGTSNTSGNAASGNDGGTGAGGAASGSGRALPGRAQFRIAG